MLHVFNTLSRRKEPFKPLRGKLVGIYTCGPSVYQRPHIGNYRTYVFEDVFKRYLLRKGYRARHVMNITDVENKAIAAARKEGKGLGMLTSHYARAFFADIKKLNMLPADAYPKASETIPEIAALVKLLARNGYAYEAGGDWFYDVSKFRGYGRLSRLKHRIAEGRRISFDDYYKWQAGDFILWRRWRKADGKAFWNTLIGKGRPGWSIECTAMGRKFLGERFDVKMGGIDNIFCHHENEIAQGWGASGKIFAKYFIHVKHLLIGGRKMSKSLGNVVRLGDLEKRGVEPLALRLFYLTAHYRRRINFTWEKVRKAQDTLGKCRACVARLKAAKAGGGVGGDVRAAVAKAKGEFEKSMDDDLQTGKALDAACGLVEFALGKESLGRSEAQAILAAMRDFDRAFGMGLF